MSKKSSQEEHSKRKRGRPSAGGIVLSAVASRSQLNDLDGICLTIRRVQPDYRIRRSELMRAIFEAALPVLNDCDWSEAKNYESLVLTLSKAIGRRK